MECLFCVMFVFFFKQKTAYDMRISDWSSDVCSSDLYTLEPRLRFGSGDDMVSGFIAAYAFRARQNEEIDLFGNGLFRDTTDTRAVFGEVTWKAPPAVSVTLGTRYGSEERRTEEHTSELQSLMRI